MLDTKAVVHGDGSHVKDAGLRRKHAAVELLADHLVLPTRRKTQRQQRSRPAAASAVSVRIGHRWHGARGWIACEGGQRPG